jgi:hypothetical protein
MMTVSAGRQQRYSGAVHNPYYIGIIIFKRNGKSCYMECADRPLGFKGKKGCSGPLMQCHVIFTGQECTLANHIVPFVQNAVNTLKAQVSHTQPVDVGVDKTY